MANVDLTPEPPGGRPEGAEEPAAPKSADQRVKELELEVARLRNELGQLRKNYDRDRALLDSYTVARMPKTEEEFLTRAREGRPFKELVDELVREHGSEE